MTGPPEGVALRLDRTDRISCAELDPGELVPFDAEAWRDVLVMVQSGALALRCRSGRTAVFEAGSMVFLAGLDLAAIGADGEGSAVLLIVRR